MPAQTTTIRLDPADAAHRVSPYIYGHFMEHLGSCIYDGAWVGEDSPIPNDGGVRLDTVEALRKINPPVIRWPGGLWADNYHWQEGIGPRADRPIRQNPWNQLEDNQFGTHEFMHFCELVGAEPYLCCNLGTGTVEEARSWAEYCNCAKDTTLARMRAANGHPAPFGVKFWGLGNEVCYALDGMISPTHYVDWARHYAGYVKMFAAQAVVPWDKEMDTVKTVLALLPSWIPQFVAAMPPEKCPGEWMYFDLLAQHYYIGGELPPDAPEQDKVARFIAALDRLEHDLTLYAAWARKLSTPSHSVDIAVDEWGTWRREADHHHGLKQATTMADAIFAAGVLHILQREPKVHMANLAQTMNVLQALILTAGEKFCVTPTYHVFEMLKGHQGGRLVPLELTGQRTLTLPGDATRESISASATVAGDGREMLVSVVNFDPDGSARVSVAVSGGTLSEVRQLGTGDVSATNGFDAPGAVTPRALPAADTLDLPPASLTTLRYAITARRGGPARS